MFFFLFCFFIFTEVKKYAAVRLGAVEVLEVVHSALQGLIDFIISSTLLPLTVTRSHVLAGLSALLTFQQFFTPPRIVNIYLSGDGGGNID